MQPQQHFAPRHGAKHARAQFRLFAFHALDQGAQILRFQGLATSEDIHNQLALRPFQRQQEMAGEIHAKSAPTRRIRGVQPQDPKRHGQAPPAFHHADQIGIRHILIGFGIALITEMPMQRFRQDQPPRFKVTAIRLAIHAGGIHHLAGDIGKMSGDLQPIRLRRVNPRQLQGNGRDIEFQIRQAAGGFNRAAWFGGVGDCHQP